MKNGVIIEPTRFTWSGTPAPFAASSRPSAEPLRQAIERPIERGVQARDRPQAGGDRERVAGQRAGLVHRTGRRDQRHQVLAAAVGADRQPAADDLAEAGQVGPHAVERLGAAAVDAEAGHHLVEDRAARRADRTACAGPSRKPAAGGTMPMLPTIGSTMTAATCAVLASNSAATLSQIVERRGQRERRGGRRDAGAGRHAERQRARAGLDEEAVGVAVVAAGELDRRDRGRWRRAPRGRALIVASVPELVKRTISIDGTSDRTFSAICTSSSVGAP